MKLLFVCTGNICRSPMAERLSVAIGDQLGLDVQARSASTLGLVDRPAHRHAVAVCAEVGLDLSDHASQPVTDELLAWADWILVMEAAHAQHLATEHPGFADKTLLLGPYDGVPEIDDPVRGWRFQFRRTRKRLERAIRAFLTRAA